MSENLFRRIFLTGFSATGKSLVAPLLANALAWRTIDTDDLIEEIAGKPIPEIFDQDGEPRFRELEGEALRRAARDDDVVIATGGGALVSLDNRRLIAEAGLLVCLEATPDTILRRLHRWQEKAPSERPLLAGADPLARIRDLKARRQHLYALADVIVETDSLSPPQVAGRVVASCRKVAEWALGNPLRLTLPEEREPAAEGGPVWVEVPSGRYPVFVEWGAISRLGERMREVALPERAFIVTDELVGVRHTGRVQQALAEAGFESHSCAVPPVEASKNLETASLIYDWLISHRAERGQSVLALGGGMVGDLAGFVAATFLRGVPLVQLPTSLLAMVDAAVGGKVAVDHREAKNLIGAFYQPCLVVEDISLLKTLPQRELVSGFAEVIKHALSLDPDLLETLEAHADDLLHLEPAVTAHVLRRNVAIKAGIVSEDELETTGRRAVLNYGHTIAHGLEAATGYGGLLHGEAVAVGMVAAAEIGRRMGLTPSAVGERQTAVLERFGLPTRVSGVELPRVLGAVALDKKVASKAVRWVLLEDVGRTVVRSDVPPSLVEETVSALLS